jgi:hypothetical protein
LDINAKAPTPLWFVDTRHLFRHNAIRLATNAPKLLQLCASPLTQKQRKAQSDVILARQSMITRCESRVNARSERGDGRGRLKMEVRVFDGVVSEVASEELGSQM